MDDPSFPQSRLQNRIPPARRGRSQSPDRDDRILQATLLILEDEGYERLTMERVATVSGVAKATLYRRWPSKAPLVADALAIAGFPGGTPQYNGASFSDDLALALAEAGGGVGKTRLFSAVFVSSRKDPALEQVLRGRYIDHVGAEMRSVMDNACLYGLQPPHPVRVDLAIEATIALVLHRSVVDDCTLSPTDFHSIVETVTLPILRGGANLT